MSETAINKKMWLGFNLAFRNLVRQKRRSINAIGIIAFGCIAMLLASGFIEWIFWGMRESTINSQLGHIQISRPGYYDSGKATPFSFLLPDTIPELETVNEAQQIKVIAPRLSLTGLISHGDANSSFIGDGVEPHKQAAFNNALQISLGQDLLTDDPMGIIIGEGLARKLGVSVGDQVILLTNTANRELNAIEVTIRGLFSTVTKSYDDNALRIPIKTAQQLLRTQGSHSWIILLNNTEQTDAVLEKLLNKFPKEEFEIRPWYMLADFYNKTLVLFTKQISGIKVIIALIILLSISNTMNMIVLERVGEIGTAMALGLKRKEIMCIFLREGILIGFLGAIIGLIVGLLSANAISNIGIPMPPPPGMARGYTGEILITFDLILESLVLAVGTTLIASIYPAWKASRMQIVNALRYNR